MRPVYVKRPGKVNASPQTRNAPGQELPGRLHTTLLRFANYFRRTIFFISVKPLPRRR